MDYLPQNPAILVSSINMLLRDEEFDSLESLCYNFNTEPEKIKAVLHEAGYVYSEEQEQFRPIDREEITKNKAIAQVGNNIRWEYDHLQRIIGADNCTLVWEKGGHFVTPHLRLAHAFAWCIHSLKK